MQLARCLSACWLLAASACSSPELPGEIFEGVVDAPAPIMTPLSQQPACVAGVALYTRSNATKKGSSSHHRPTPKWASGVTLEVAGERLTLEGDSGEPKLVHQGEQWKWDPSVSPRTVPEALHGWGFDASIEALVSDAIDDSYTHFEATERFTRCGEILRVRAERSADRLVLVDAQDARSEEAFAFFGKLVFGFLLFFVTPIIALFVFVVRRARSRG